MFTQKLLKPDGRQLTLYSRYPIASDIQAPSPSPIPIKSNPHLRWHPLRLNLALAEQEKQLIIDNCRTKINGRLVSF